MGDTTLDNQVNSQAIPQQEYFLNSFLPNGQKQQVFFYETNKDGSVLIEGTTLEEMLRVCIERANLLNSRFSSRESALAITKMQEALMWFNERTRVRKERGVLGQHVV